MAEKLSIGDMVVVKPGATTWMKDHDYWDYYMPVSIDLRSGTITEDFTCFSGNDSHYSIDLGLEYYVGVNEEWIKKINNKKHE